MKKETCSVHFLKFKFFKYLIKILKFLGTPIIGLDTRFFIQTSIPLGVN